MVLGSSQCPSPEQFLGFGLLGMLDVFRCVCLTVHWKRGVMFLFSCMSVYACMHMCECMSTHELQKSSEEPHD